MLLLAARPLQRLLLRRTLLRLLAGSAAGTAIGRLMVKRWMRISPRSYTAKQSGDAVGIETLAREILDNLQRLFGCVRLLVRTIRGQSIERVGDSDDASQKRNLIAGESIRISAAVESLVVEFDAGKHFGELRDRTQNVGALGRVRLHHFKFFFGQSPGLFQDVIFDADFADVVELGRNLQGFHEGLSRP